MLFSIVGALLLLDRFFGYSTGWMRYISAELQLNQIKQEFQMDWNVEKANWQGNIPDKDQVVQMIIRCKSLVTQVNNIIRTETNEWLKEFESAIRQIDELSKTTKPLLAEPGSLNLTVTNGDATDEWTISIDNGNFENHKGKTACKGNLSPGNHEIKINGNINGKAVHAEKIFIISAGAICNETLTLE